MNVRFTLRGLGHRGRIMAHQLALERPVCPRYSSADFEFTVIDLQDNNIELLMLASTINCVNDTCRRVALVLMPEPVNLEKAPAALLTVKEQYDAWVPVLPYEVANPVLADTNQQYRGYLPVLRSVFWRLTRLVYSSGYIAFEDMDFRELWTNGRTMWSFQVVANGPNRADVARQLLEAASAEPMFWNAHSGQWMIQFSTSSQLEHELTMDEIVAITEPLMQEPFDLQGFRWGSLHNENLGDTLVVDVLALGEHVEHGPDLPLTRSAHRFS